MILAGDFIPKSCSIDLPNEFECQQVLANLEGPICEDGLLMSDKVGACLHTTPLEALFDSIRPFSFSSANNHMMDFREEGFRQTSQVLAVHGIPFAGAGMCEGDARKPMFVEENGMRVAVFSCCEAIWDVHASFSRRGGNGRVALRCHSFHQVSWSG